jgi:glucan phosphoethanolaminetransferase (alkaline phosphatase superfamily)
MKRFFNQLTRNFVRTLAIAFVAVSLVISFAGPAAAFGKNSRSNPSEGTAQMNDLQETSRRAVKEEPRSRSEVQRKAQRGPNEVQGDADMRGMNVPDNSKKATTVRKQAEEALKKVTPGD